MLKLHFGGSRAPRFAARRCGWTFPAERAPAKAAPGKAQATSVPAPAAEVAAEAPLELSAEVAGKARTTAVACRGDQPSPAQWAPIASKRFSVTSRNPAAPPGGSPPGREGRDRGPTELVPRRGHDHRGRGRAGKCLARGHQTMRKRRTCPTKRGLLLTTAGTLAAIMARLLTIPTWRGGPRQNTTVIPKAATPTPMTTCL
mmetsp:Transcript_37965/g.104381  ORF Transcript_37965/g.104381 Transcript_37965/m.104381 type:complete len:201 (-) Transcript_37965:254-856(-)